MDHSDSSYFYNSRIKPEPWPDNLICDLEFIFLCISTSFTSGILCMNDAFKISLSLLFWNFTIMQKDVNLFLLILCDIYWTYCICRFMSISSRKFSIIHSSNIFCIFLFSLSETLINYMYILDHVIPPSESLRLFFTFFMSLSLSLLHSGYFLPICLSLPKFSLQVLF